ncbi:MAG: 4Fe-4S dicluster domain-containing protein [Croceibacterium sp.]
MGWGIIVGRRTKKGYKPPFLHWLLKPKEKGSDINGRGERTFRRPRPVYHFRDTPEVRLAFRHVQQLFYMRMYKTKSFHQRIQDRKFNITRPLVDIAPAKQTDTAESWTKKVKEFSLANEADLVGIARMRPEWVFEGYEIEQPWIIMHAVKQDYEKIATAPDYTTNEEVLDQYNRAHRANFALANWIREQGHYAERYKGFLGTPITMIPPAIAAGLGQLGKHGSLINRTLGPNFRLGYVVTDMPLISDNEDDIPVDDFCMSCQICTRECPTEAISDSKQWVRGVEKWYVDFDKCVPFFNDTFGCNVCVATCPFSRPNVSEPLLMKLLKRKDKRLAEAAAE